MTAKLHKLLEPHMKEEARAAHRRSTATALR